MSTPPTPSHTASAPLRYRWRVVGNQPLLHSLEADLIQKKLAHAYIFSGPPEVGKKTVAVTLAHILQCENDFCHDCTTCSQITKGIHSETIEFRDDGEQLGIEAIRDLVFRLNLTPSAPYKIVIIERAERMTTEAANCLLKTLEEPPSRTIFILTTDNLREILPTVISRSRVLPFQLCDESLLLDFLKEKYMAIEEDTLHLVVELSLGRPGVAFKIIEDPELMRFYKSLYVDVSRFFQFNNVFERMTYLQEFIEDKNKITIFLDIFTHLVRRNLLLKVENGSKYIELIDQISLTQSALRNHVNPRLALENLMLSF